MPKIVAPVDPDSFAANILAMSKSPQKNPPWMQKYIQQWIEAQKKGNK